MTTNPEFMLDESQESRMEMFCKVASLNGCTLTIEELIRLMSLEITEIELQRIWSESANLNRAYSIDSGLVADRENESNLAQTIKKNQERFRRAISNMEYAKDFASHISGERNLRTMCVSGSTSYLSVSEDDDLDLFCITARDSLWIFLTKALIRARWIRLRNKKHPQLCFSYILDEMRAEEEFSSERSELFARDALMASVVYGNRFYTRLLMRCSWMKDFFPRLYRERIGSERPEIEEESKLVPAGSSLASLLFRVGPNFLLYWTVGSYLKIKSWFLNRKFSRQGQSIRAFQIKLGRGHCILESEDYLRLKEVYSNYANKNGFQETA